MRRGVLGIIALAFIVTGVWFLVFPPTESVASAAAGSSVRIGFVLGALFLAWPHLERIPKSIYVSLFFFAMVVAVRPKLVILALPALLVYWLVKPYPKKSG